MVPKTKQVEKEKLKVKTDNYCHRSVDKQSEESVESDLKKRKKATLGRICSEGVMDDESSESMEPMEEVPLIRLGESELERLVRG